MIKKIFAGYQVRSKDLSGISFQDYSLEICKKYCRDGYVIVSTYHKRFGINIRIGWTKWDRPIWFSKNMRRFNILWLHVCWDYLTKEVPDKIVWDPQSNKKQGSEE